mmetsp:Transcript_42360/g.48146  ORF Transcript_42360/g.48146 Transcript_42360/m.48146 type:complete len:87 (-) Transcript_42360:451-711(-)
MEKKSESLMKTVDTLKRDDGVTIFPNHEYNNRSLTLSLSNKRIEAGMVLLDFPMDQREKQRAASNCFSHLIHVFVVVDIDGNKKNT